MDLNKEKAALFHVMDKFFGTTGGDRFISTDTFKIHDKNFPNIFSELGRLGVMLCGGAITSLFSGDPVNDLDFYVKKQENIRAAEAYLKTIFKDHEHITLNALTLKRASEKSKKLWSVQVIRRFTGDAAEIFDWFDFTVTHGAFDFEQGVFHFGDRFFTDVAKKKLVYSGASKYPICAMYRTKKYMDKGYSISGATIMHIALSIVQLKIENYGQLKEQLMGIDTSFLQKLLDEEDPTNPVDYGEFMEKAFRLIDGIGGLTEAEQEEQGNG
jgi:hypothetical protein